MPARDEAEKQEPKEVLYWFSRGGVVDANGARDGESLTLGHIYVAPAGHHRLVKPTRVPSTPRELLQILRFPAEQVTIRELAIDIRRAVALALDLGIYAYDAYILEAARSAGFPLLALDGPIRQNAAKLGLPLVELEH